VSPKHLRRIAVGLAVLLLLWGGTEFFARGSDTVTGSLGLPAVDQAAVDTVTIVKGADSIVLAKQASTAWTVNGHAAALSAVGDLFQALKDTVRPELVAEDPSSFARLGVDSAGARWLSLRSAGKPLLTLLAGGPGSEFSSVYVRRPGDAHVYLWRGRLAALLERGADDWRDKRIAALEPDSIAAIDVVRGRDRYTLRRAGRAWRVNGAAADSAAVARYLERLRAITASGFAEPQTADSLKARRAVRRFTARTATGRVLLALAFDSTATGFLVHRVAVEGGRATPVYRMNFWDADGVTPASRSLAAAPHN
jgi:hypothetical protein